MTPWQVDAPEINRRQRRSADSHCEKENRQEMDEDDFRRRADPGVIDISNLVGSYSRENIGTLNSDSSLVSRDMATT